MSPGARRIIIPVLVGGIGFGLVLAVILARAKTPPAPTPPANQGTPVVTPADPATDPPAETATDPETEPGDDPASAADADTALPDGDVSLDGLTARVTGEPATGPPAMLGSLDANVDKMQVELTTRGAGIATITLSDVWDTAANRAAGRAHYAAVAAGDPNPPPLPADEHRYVVAATQTHDILSTAADGTQTITQLDIPVMAAQAVTINGAAVRLLDDVWTETGPGAFATEIVNGDGAPVLGIARRFTLGRGNDITLEQRIENVSGRPLQVQWTQFGPADLFPDRAAYLDRRRIRFGYIRSTSDPMLGPVLSDKTLLLERRDIVKQDEGIWPNDDSIDQGLSLSWFASTNRYFALAVHPVLDADGAGDRTLKSIESISFMPLAGEWDEKIIFTYTRSPTLTMDPGSVATLDVGIFAGPMDRYVLADEQPYNALNMAALVLYQMSTCCAVCTFQWLAVALINFLGFVSGLLGDWGVAIILLVVLVRLLLHPLTKKSQISMQRFSKQMQVLKPEIDKLQQKYGSDPKKMQQEQMRLFREHGVNPLQFLGCMPMFLQMPIWIALYAMLYFAFDIRHEPAFYGIFQAISGGAWPFLADLSAADRFIPIFPDPKPVQFLGFYFDFSSINLLPLLMGVLFFIQQKYMTPPASPSMTPEQQQQQKIMKVIFVVMMPVLLYSAPSGLTLYILTSSTIGILESRYVRNHIKDMDLNPEKHVKKPSKSRDAVGRAYAQALERMEEKRKQKARKAQPSFKDKKKKRRK